MATKEGVLSKYFGFIVGKRKVDPEQARLELRRQARELETESRTLSVDQKRLGIQMDKLVNRGVKAAKQGDSIGKRDAARELRDLRIQRQDIDNRRSTLSKARLVAQRASRQLEWAQKDGSLALVNKLQETLSNPELEAMLNDASIRSEDVSIWLDRAIGQLTEELEFGADVEAADLAEDEGLFDKLAGLVDEGNQEEAARVKSALTGEKSSPEEPELDEEPY